MIWGLWSFVSSQPFCRFFSLIIYSLWAEQYWSERQWNRIKGKIWSIFDDRCLYRCAWYSECLKIWNSYVFFRANHLLIHRLHWILLFCKTNWGSDASYWKMDGIWISIHTYPMDNYIVGRLKNTFMNENLERIRIGTISKNCWRKSKKVLANNEPREPTAKQELCANYCTWWYLWSNQKCNQQEPNVFFSMNFFLFFIRCVNMNLLIAQFKNLYACIVVGQCYLEVPKFYVKSSLHVQLFLFVCLFI